MIILSFILQMQEVRLGGPKSRGDCPSARGAPRRGDTGEWQHTWGWPQGCHFGERSPLGPHGVPRVGKGTLSRARVEMPLPAAHGAGGTAVGCRRWRGPMRLPRRQTESSQRCGTWAYRCRALPSRAGCWSAVARRLSGAFSALRIRDLLPAAPGAEEAWDEG